MEAIDVAILYVTEELQKAIDQNATQDQQAAAIRNIAEHILSPNATPTLTEFAASKLELMTATLGALDLKKLEAEEIIASEIASLESGVADLTAG